MYIFSLSENNCIEVVSCLISCGLIDLVTSTDAKEYVTRPFIESGIKNECFANGNRINVNELSAKLHVTLDHIKASVVKIVRDDTDRYIYCEDELISRYVMFYF